MEGVSRVDANSTELPYEHHPFVEYLKFTWSCCIVIFAIVVICAGISSNYSVLSYRPEVLFVILLLSLLLLAYVEGLHYAVVSVERWDVAKYRNRFPRGYRTHSLVNTPSTYEFITYYVFLKYIIHSPEKKVSGRAPILRYLRCLFNFSINFIPKLP